MPTKPTTPNRWLIIFSPYVIAIIFCIVIIVTSLLSLEQTKGWSFLGAAIFIPALLILLLMDIIVKLILRKKVLQLWITELVLIAAGIVIYLNYI